MSDSIRSIGSVPQISKLSPNKRTGDKKDNKENKKDFTEHMSDNDKEVKGRGHNQVKEDSENTEHNKQDDVNTLHEKKEDGFDDSCGSLLDAEL
ncbi:MAG: hypothetical protein GY775_10430 [Candidatus Scalindua sp.]|nr:hypothetical protein [Candidatus Scalindua sp.]